MNTHFSTSQVSVLIPAYNTAKFLPEAIESVLNQTYPIFEIIVVDDGSTDNTKEICDRYPSIKYIYQENQGLIGARNTALYASKGEYLLFFDSDDYLYPNAVEAAVNCINSHPDAGYVYGNYVFETMNSDGSYTTEEIYDNSKAPSTYESIIAGKIKLQVASVLFRSSAVKSVGGFDPRGEDYNLFLLVARYFPIYFHKELMLKYRYNGANMSGKPKYLINVVRTHALEWNYIQQTGNKEYKAAYEQGKEIWIKLFTERMPYEIMKYAQTGQWLEGLEYLRLILHYDPQLKLVDRDIYEAAYQTLILHLRELPYNSSLNYWKQQLTEVPELLSLPTDHPRPANPTFQGSSQTFVISPELTTSLKSLSDNQKVSLSTTLLTAFKTLLNRYTNSQDIVVGSPVTTSLNSKVFMNAVPIRTVISENPTFANLLQKVQEVTSLAHTYSNVPLEIIIEELQIKIDLSYSPLFQVVFTLQQDISLQKIELSNLSATPYVIEDNEGKFDLNLFIEETDQQISGKWLYNTDIFDVTTIERINQNFQHLLTAIVANPEHSISELEILVDQEKQLLSQWNNTTKDYPLQKCIHALVEEQVEITPDAVAVISGEQQLTYRELNNKANQLAHYLQQFNIKPDSLVGICVERSIEMVVGLLGILKAGAGYVPLDQAYPSERLQFMLEDTQVAVLLTTKNIEGLPKHNAQVVYLDTDWDVIAQETTENLVTEVKPENIGYIIYTSGSTGKPKGVIMPQLALCNLIFWQLENTQTVKPVTLQFSPISFDVSFQEIFSTWCAGGKLVLITEELRRDARGLLEILKEQCVERLFLPFVALQNIAEEFVEAPELHPQHLREVITAGEQLQITPAITNLFQKLNHATLHNHYGPSESHVVTAYKLTGTVETWPKLPSIGKPISNSQIHILDSHLQPVPIGVPGELYIGGFCLAKGYLNRPDLSEERFIPNPLDNGQTRLYKSGDSARYLADGNIECLGRIDSQVKIRGFRIELGEVETTLAQYPDIRELAVIVREDVAGDKRLVAYIVPQPNREISIKELRTFISQKLPQYMVPSAFVILNSLPLTPSGKLDRKSLPAVNTVTKKLEETSTNVTTAASEETSSGKTQAETEKILIGIWQEVLGIEDISIEDNFFELGGHSLLIARLRNKISTALDMKISVVEIFQYPTIESLTKCLVERNLVQKENTKYKSSSGVVETSKSTEFSKDIAIIGMSGRFPGAANIQEFWENLRDGVESIVPLSDDELLAAGVDPTLLKNPNYIKVGGLLPKTEEFDANFFGYNPIEAQLIDPQQRIYLECAWEALESAGYQPDSNSYKVGVYGGIAPSIYLLNNICQNEEIAAGRLIESPEWLQAFVGNNGDFLTSRVAYKLNLTGPAITIQTACSTSLVAVHLACESLIKGDCDIALAGGVSLQKKMGYLYQEGMIFSHDGHCHAFDADAKGMISGDGVAIVVLKPLKQAIADGDYIYATIKGSAINNDGKLKVGFTAPGVNGQAAVISAAQANAGVSPETITYIETHGTGTPLGDPIEVAGLTQAFRSKTDQKNYCAIGSLKTNVGHLNSAAGVGSLIKTVLALKNQQIPPSLNFNKPNPEIDFENSPFFVNTQLLPWETNGFPRRAGVSAFGFGGTNAHIVLEEWNNPSQNTQVNNQQSKQLLVLSARTATALDKATDNLANYLAKNPDTNLANVAYTLSVGRVGFNHRRVVVVDDVPDAVNTLTDRDKKRIFTNSGTVKPRSVVFMFSGQGSQYVNMARELYEKEPYFQEQIDICCEILQPHLGFDLREVLYPTPEETATATAKLTQTATTQPALFVIEYAIAKLWMKMGITPVAMIGHSIGEYIAATLAGVFSLEDALALVAARGQLMESMPPGSMLAVPLPEQEVQPLLEGTSLQIAVINSPSNCVVSGTTPAIEEFAKQLQEKGIEGRLLHTSHAFHSQMMAAILEPFTEKVTKIRLNSPQIPFVSNVTGTWITAAEATNPSYYAQHLRQAVRFADGVQQFFDNPNQILLEVGPGRTLSTLAQRHPDKPKEQVTLTSTRHPQDEYSDISFIMNSLGQMWLAGLEINWSAFYGEQQLYRIPLPTYPFERKRYWVEPTKQTTKTKLDEGKKPDITDWFYVPTWKQSFNISTAKIQSPILVFIDECSLGSQLITKLESQNLEIIKVVIGEKFQQLDNHSYRINPSQPDDYKALIQGLIQQKLTPKTILHLWNVTANIPADLTIELVDQQQELGFYSLLYLAQALGEKNVIDEMKMIVVSNHLQNVNGEEQLCPGKATLIGLVRVIPQEYPHIHCTSVDVVLPSAGSKGEQKLITQLLSEIEQKSTDQMIAYRGNHRWIQTFEPVRLEALDIAKTQTLQFKAKGVYLITGGLGGIGLTIAVHLAKTFQAKLILNSRVSLPERNQWEKWLSEHDAEDIISEKIRKIQELEALGSEVLVVQADVTNLQQMERAIATAKNQFGQINGVIHSAGVPGGGVIQMKDRETAKKVLAPKVQGTIVLDRIFKDSQLDFVILCSSMASIIGIFGQVDYTAANAFLDAYAHYQTDSEALLQAVQNRLTISINWDAWKEVGMAANIMNSDLFILPQEGIEVFNRISHSGLSQVAVSTHELATRIKQSKLKTEALTEFAPETVPRSPENNLSVNQIEQTMIQIWQKVLGIENIGLDDNFFELGGDSLVAVNLFAQIEKTFGKRLSLATLFQSKTVKELALLLRTEEKSHTSSTSSTFSTSSTSSTFSSLIPIQPHGTKPPLFLIHAIWGNILFYRELVSYLPPDQPVYGLQAKGLDGKEEPITSIAEMASNYIQEIRKVQPQGPYFIGGYSLGGAVAFEMAQQIHSQGDKVAMLAIFDMPAPKIYDPNSFTASTSISNRMLSHLHHFLTLKPADKLNYLFTRVQFHLTIGKVSIFYRLYLRYIAQSPTSIYSLNIASVSNKALLSYMTSSVYPDTLTLFRTFDDKSEDFDEDREWGWGKITHKVEVYEVPGKHTTVMHEPNVKVMAEKLTLCLEQAHRKILKMD